MRAAKILVSVETYSPAVTRACLEAGANILNLTGTAGTGEFSEWSPRTMPPSSSATSQGKNVREVGDFDLSADPVPMMRDYFSAAD